MRIINADKMIEDTERMKQVADGIQIDGIIKYINENAIEKDLEEIKYGKWVYYDCVSSYDGAKSVFACSVCHGAVDEEIFDSEEFHKKWCGNCGAKMDLEGDFK